MEKAVSYLKGLHLKVEVPITTNGIDVVMKDDAIQYKASFLPLTARKLLEKKNEKLPPFLRMKFTEVDPGKKGPGRPKKEDQKQSITAGNTNE